MTEGENLTVGISDENCILGRGSIRSEEYKLFSDGIDTIQNHIFTGRINDENAGI